MGVPQAAVSSSCFDRIELSFAIRLLGFSLVTCGGFPAILAGLPKVGRVPPDAFRKGSNGNGTCPMNVSGAEFVAQASSRA